MKIIKNFLEEKEFTDLKNLMMGPSFDWYYNPYVNTEEDNYFQFTHIFCDEGNPRPNLRLLNSLITKLKMKEIYRIKANLLTKTNTIIEHGFHVDHLIKNKKSKTAIFYINTCNGYTKFKNNKKIYSEENKVCFFPTNTPHSGSSCTDQDIRIVINCNYII